MPSPRSTLFAWAFARSARLALLLIAMFAPLAPASGGAEDDVDVRANLGATLSENDEVAASLEASLSAFLGAIFRGESTAAHLAPGDAEKHSFFFSALASIGSRLEGSDLSPLVLKSFPLDGDDYLLTLAFLTTRDDRPQISRIVELHAYARGDVFGFKSPFHHRTASLRTQTLGNVTFHFATAFDEQRAREFAEFKTHIEHLLGAPPTPLDYYCFDSLDALLKAYGLVHDATKCNWLTHDLGFLDGDGRIYVTGTGDERYIFGFLRSFLQLHGGDEADLYAPFSNGVAAYYGGYALSGDDMPTLKAQFRAKLAQDPEINFLREYEKGRKSSVNRHFTYYVIGAFICEEVLERHGFPEVLRLLSSGADGERFFDNIEDILGVDKAGFHELILRLIDAKPASR